MNKQLTGEKNGKPTQLKMLCSNLNPRQSMTPMKLILSRIYSSTLPFSLSLHFMGGPNDI